MRIVRRERDDAPRRRERIPLPQRRDRPVEQQSERATGPPEVSQQRARNGGLPLVPPLAVGVQPLETLERHGPVAPGELTLRGDRVRGDPEAAEAGDVLGDRRPVAAEWIWSAANAERDV